VADWTTISSLATATGTLVLAVATFSSVRSANRAARVAERALDAGLRPVLFPSRLDDAAQKIRWGDDHLVRLPGGRATVEEVDGNIYLAMSLRNVAAGIAVLHGWRGEPAVRPARLSVLPGERPDAFLIRPALEEFRLQGRDLYVPSGEMSFWQAAIRDPGDPDRARIHEAIEAGAPLTIDLLYGDHEGGQRTISRFMVTPLNPGSEWLCSVVRHWNLDHQDPR
jgi:hypothetical protein